MKVAFLGMGIMGSRMAANLIKAGHDVTVWNRTAEKTAELVQQGAKRANSPAEAVSGQDAVITMLANPAAVEDTALGKQGFLAQMQPGQIWMDSSTVNPSFSQRMSERAAQQQVHFLDAPVAGSKEPAAKGQLLFLVGGDAQDVETVRPLIEAMGRSLLHVGGVSMGASLKMVFNLLLAQSMLAFSEGLLLGEALGIDRTRLFELLGNSAVVAPSAVGKRAKIESGDYSAEFPLQWMQKDLELAAVSAYEQGLALPSGNVAKEIYMLAVRQGLAGEDFSAIYQFLAEKKR